MTQSPESAVYRPDEVLFHIGAPKTGTTTLQNLLRANAGRFDEQGVTVYTPSDLRGSGQFLPYQAYIAGKVAQPNAERFLTLFDGRKPTRAILSEEAMTNDLMPTTKTAKGGFMPVEPSITFLKSLEIPQTKILLTVRRQDQFLKSTYGHLVKHHGKRRMFKGWSEGQVNLRQLSWLKIVDQLDAAFGPDNVIVVPQELLFAQGQGAYYSRCFGALQLDLSAHDVSAQVDANTGLSDQALRVGRILNEISLTEKEDERVRTQLIQQVNDFARAHGAGSPDLELAPLTATLKRIYARENRELAQRKFSDLVTDFDFSKS